MSILDDVRTACAQVTARARQVHLERERLVPYARALPRAQISDAPPPELPRNASGPAERAAFVLCLDAINFGSGWFPLLRKLPGHSGYRTLEARLGASFERCGAPRPEQLAQLEPEDCARLFGQVDAPREIRELMALYARALRDLGRFVGDGWLAPIERAGGSAERLVEGLCAMPLYRDVARYGALEVPVLKRAQITAHDLGAAGVGRFGDLDRLTLFADNLVPHVLRLDGVLRFDAGLVERIDAETLLEPGSPEEVEIRACALTAVESLAADTGLPARWIDGWLWRRGALPRYKARPRHRCRCAYY